jgi:hypothetical protein
LFFSAINAKNTNSGGFKNSALSQYLNAQFIDALEPIKGILSRNKDGSKITLPTLYEVFGDDDEGKEVNWESEPRQLEYFLKIKNRIQVKDNDTKWWWLSSPTASSTTIFCNVSTSGAANYNHASITYGVSPCFCLS